MVPVECAGADGSAGPVRKHFDMDDSDEFWMEHAGEPLPVVGEAIHAVVEELRAEEVNLRRNSCPHGDVQTHLQSLAAAMEVLPDMSGKKRNISKHYSVASALLTEVHNRKLHHIYEMEREFPSQPPGRSIQQVDELLADKVHGTAQDKARALMVLYLLQPSIDHAQLQSLICALKMAGGDAAGLTYLQHLEKMRNLTGWTVVREAVATPSIPKASLASSLSTLGTFGRDVFVKGIESLKNIVATNKETPVCQIFADLMNRTQTRVTENFECLDPLAYTYPTQAAAQHLDTPFQRGIMFVVGGGNYTEVQALQQWAQRHGREVHYGSTDIVSPEQFLSELCSLGSQLEGTFCDIDLNS